PISRRNAPKSAPANPWFGDYTATDVLPASAQPHLGNRVAGQFGTNPLPKIGSWELCGFLWGSAHESRAGERFGGLGGSKGELREGRPGGSTSLDSPLHMTNSQSTNSGSVLGLCPSK